MRGGAHTTFSTAFPCMGPCSRGWQLIASRGICHSALLQRARESLSQAADSTRPLRRTLPDSVRVFAGSNGSLPLDVWQDPENLAFGYDGDASLHDSIEELPQPLGLQRRAHVLWQKNWPNSVLIVKKPNVVQASHVMKEMGEWLQTQGLKVLVERPVHHHEFSHFEIYNPGHHVDLCVSLGGDGTVLHLASLFEHDLPLPPVVSFAMGTLGFLTPFDIQEYRLRLQRVIEANDNKVFCTLRTRKRCEIRFGGSLKMVHHVLNECLIDRGASPSMVWMECHIDGYHVTNILADGLIIATPSGSTAYSMSAGGPMVAPSVPGTLLTPIAPQSLSFRPLVVPEQSEIEICLPAHSKAQARASFDGRHPMRLPRDSSIRCTTSQCALPMINMGKLDHDWYQGITQKLKWNVPIREEHPPNVGNTLLATTKAPA